MKTSAPWAWILLVVGAGLAGSGCARLKSFTDERHPMLGSTVLPEPGSQRPINGDLYAQRQSKQAERRKELLASSGHPQSARDARAAQGPLEPEDAADGPVRGGEPTTPLAVALEPPVSLPNARASGTAPAGPRARPEAERSDATLTQLDSPGNDPPALPPEDKDANAPTQADALERVVSSSRTKLDGLTSYQVLMTRQERVGSVLLDREQVLLSVRREPKAVRLEWPNGPFKGREVIYSASENNGLMHVNMADSALPMPRVALAPDSPMVLRKSRHPITEAGYDTILQNVEKTLEHARKGDQSLGTVSYEGLQRTDAAAHRCHKVVRVTPSGETWVLFIDPKTSLPVQVQANDAKGELLEKYSFDTPKLNLPELASADAFSPNARWGEPKGLLQRLSRAGSATGGQSTTR